MTPRIIERLIDSIITKDDVEWSDIDILNDLRTFYGAQLKDYVLLRNGDNGKALINHLSRYVDVLQSTPFRPDHIRIAAINRAIFNLKELVNF